MSDISESDRLDILIDKHTETIDEYDKGSNDRILHDALLVSRALDDFNRTQQKNRYLIVYSF
jgi:hypothetical protein